MFVGNEKFERMAWRSCASVSLAAHPRAQIDLLQSLDAVENIEGATLCRKMCGLTSLSTSAGALAAQFVAVLLLAPLVAWIFITPWGFRLANKTYARTCTASREPLRGRAALCMYAVLGFLASQGLAAAGALALTVLYGHRSRLSLAERLAPMLCYTVVLVLLFAWVVQHATQVAEQSSLRRLRRLMRRAGPKAPARESLQLARLESQLEAADYTLGLNETGALEADDSASSSGASDEAAAATGLDTTVASAAGPAASAAWRTKADEAVERISVLFERSSRSPLAAALYALVAVACGTLGALAAPLQRLLGPGRYSSSEAFIGGREWLDGASSLLAMWAMFGATAAVAGLLLRGAYELRAATVMLQLLHRAGTPQTTLVVGSARHRQPWLFCLSNLYLLYLWRDVRARLNSRWLDATRQVAAVVAVALLGALMLALFILARLLTLGARGRVFDVLGSYAAASLAVLLMLLYSLVAKGIRISRFRVSQQYYLTEQKHRMRGRAGGLVESELLRAIDTQMISVAETRPPAVLGIELTAQLRNRIIGVVVTTLAGALVRYINL